MSGQEYGYLVQTQWTSKGPRQKVTAYLGKILRPACVRETSFQEFIGENTLTFLSRHSFPKIVEKLVQWELHKHKLEEKVQQKSEGLIVRKKPVVLAVGEGFLCNASIKHILEYAPEKDYTGFILADRLTAAGIRIDKETFVGCFEKLQKQEEEVTEKEFYY